MTTINVGGAKIA